MGGIKCLMKSYIGQEINYEVSRMGVWGVELYQNDTSMDASAKAARIKVLDDLQEKLLSSLPSVKKSSAKKRTYKCQWKLGDVFAYRLDSDLAKAQQSMLLEGRK